MFQNKKIKAFTLVELIVTITILAILGTIAFISFQGYSRDARDSIRSADIALIQKALETYKIPVGKYPIPTDTEPVLFSGSTAWTQGTVGDSVIQNLSNLNKIPLDPLYGTEYTYSVTSDYKEFEVGALFEGDLLGSNLFINQANANPNYTAYIKGTYNGKTLRVRAGGKDYILAVPTIISTDIAGWTLQDLINNFKLVFHGYGNLPASYEGVIADLEGGFNYAPGAIVVFSGSIEDLKDTSTQIEFIQNLQTAYSGTILNYTQDYYEIANVQIDPNNPTDEVIALASMNINLNTGLDLPVPIYTSSLPPLSEVSGGSQIGETGLTQAEVDELNALTGFTYTISERLAFNGTLNLSDKGLTSIPTGVYKLVNLDTLHLESLFGPLNEITSISSDIGNLINLTVLDLTGNTGLSSLPAEIGNLTNLTQLQLGSTNLTTLPTEMSNLNLSYLNLTGNTGLGALATIFDFNSTALYQDDIPVVGQRTTIVGNGTTIDITVGAIPPVTNLTQTEVDELNTLTSQSLTIAEWEAFTGTLNLMDKGLTSIPTGVYDLVNLNTLYLQSTGFFGQPANEITTISSEIGNLVNLNLLDISGNLLSSLPAEIGNLFSITNLNLRGNNLISLPVEIWNLTSLENLNLGSNSVSVHSNVGNLTNLNIFDVSGNGLTTLPTEISSLSNLQYLILSSNDFSSIPVEILGLTLLKDLDLGYNSLTSIPSSIGNLTNLIDLDLTGNSLTTLPTEIGNLVSLNWLDLDVNNLTSIPSSIGNLTNLLDLDLTNNNLTSVPTEIGNLSNLTGLRLRVNSLTSIPSSIGNLSNLNTLTLNLNSLTTLPSEIGNLTNLTTLWLMDNIGLGVLSDSFGVSSTLTSQTNITPLGETVSIEGNGTTIDITVISVGGGLITQTDCTSAGWFWVSDTQDVYIGSTQGGGFCISPRFGDWNNDSILGNGGISFNGWGNVSSDYYNGWDASPIDDTGSSTYQTSGQTRILDSEVSYNCKTLGTASSDFDTSDTLVGRMKWLATTGNDYTEARSIDWITLLVPHTVGTYPHVIPALYIADCIDGVKDLGTDMDYKHYPNEGLNETITYSQYSTDVTINTAVPSLTNTIYQNRQKYLTAWTQKSGSHLPSAFSYIVNGYSSAADSDGDNLVGVDRGEYQVACEAGVLTDSNDDVDNEWTWLAALGFTDGQYWGSQGRVVGTVGCGDQTGNRTGSHVNINSTRFVIRP